jgi:hypothetical protein
MGDEGQVREPRLIAHPTTRERARRPAVARATNRFRKESSSSDAIIRKMTCACPLTEQKNHGEIRLLVTSPQEVALRNFGPHAASQHSARQVPQLAPVDLSNARRHQLLLDLSSHCEGLSRIDGRGEERL